MADRGIVLSGGGTLLAGLDERLATAMQLPVRVADDPLHATILGIGRTLNEMDGLCPAAPGQRSFPASPAVQHG